MFLILSNRKPHMAAIAVDNVPHEYADYPPYKPLVYNFQEAKVLDIENNRVSVGIYPAYVLLQVLPLQYLLGMGFHRKPSGAT